MDDLYQVIAEKIEQRLDLAFTPEGHRSVGGGCINRTVLLEGMDQRYFVKLNQSSLLDVFIAEVAGLDAIASTHTLRTPAVIVHGTYKDQAYLVLEYISRSRSDANTLKKLGEGLARLHRTSAPRFGWHRNNTIGSTPQINTETDDWVAFLREHRLGYQLELAFKNGLPAEVSGPAERLLSRLGGLFDSYKPVPSLLHGDLWGGNFSADEQGMPVLFDPAVYFGDREADIAMTELFGGFDRSFYEAYNNAWPLDQGYAVRKTLYNLYHVLNHFNLFGGGYGAQARSMIHQLLAELG